MGQPVVVTQKQSSRPGVVRYELNRTLTGTGHEVYRPGTPISGHRPPDVLAKRLFEQVRGIESIHIMGGMVTVEMSFGSDADVAKVWDAFEKAEEFILNIAKKAKSSKVEAKHTDLERYLREAMEKYKAECLVSPDEE